MLLVEQTGAAFAAVGIATNAVVVIASADAIARTRFFRDMFFMS